MKFSLMLGVCSAVVMTTQALFAQADKPKTIKVVGLESDADNATVVASSELGAKPPVVSISADALVEKAKESGATATAESKVNTANVKALTVEGMVIPPSGEMVKTLEEAVRNILMQAGKQIGTVSTNGIENLTMQYQQLGDGKSYEVEWRKALRLLLTPVGYNFTEDDGDLVLFGRSAEVDIKHKQLAQERLTSNRTPILFTTNESEGGMELRNAIRDVSIKAGVTITTDYMEQSDLYVPMQSVASEGALTAEQIGKAKEKATVQQSQVKRTKFDTNGQQIEWRSVLREILNPHDYDFVEMNGVVRIAKRAKLAQWEQEAIAQKPLTAKVIRLYHAEPEQVVERMKNIKGLLKHPNASLQATRKKDDNTDVVKNLNARIQTSGGQQSGMSDTTSQVFDKLVRPRTVPAIIAYDLEENMAAIESKIRLFDIKEKQILIEAIIFQLDTDNGGGDMDGFKWSGFENFVPLYGSVGNVANNVNTFSDLMALKDAGGADVLKDTPVFGPKLDQYGSKIQEVIDGKGTGRFEREEKYNYQSRINNHSGFRVRDGGQVWMRTDKFDFRTLIQMMRERSNTKILASPMLVVGDHSQAAIQVSNIDPIPQIDSSSLAGFASNGGVQETLNIQWNMLRSGILMWVAPEITESGSSVRMTVHPQVTTKGNIVDLGELGGKFSEYPIYNYELKQHEMDTRATVPSGATLMFGGLIDNVEEEVETKVRWLADVPLIGWFFRSKTKQLVQKNLVIMIRPTILDDTDQTGFETNALKEAKSVMVNSGRDLKKTPIGGPYSVKEIKKKVKDLYEERVVKPFRDDEEEKPVQEESAAVSQEAAPIKEGVQKDAKAEEGK